MISFSKEHAQWALLLGRLCIGVFFVFAGVQKVLGGVAGVAGYIGSVGLPMPEVLAVLAIIVELGAGTALILGYYTRKAALTLTVFVILATVFFHTDFADPMQAGMFWKNTAIIGGLLAYLAVGAGSLSLDTKLRGAGEAHNLPPQTTSTV